MKTKTALIIAIILGLFTYTLPLYAGDKEHHIEEKTVFEIPVVGKITTKTSSYLSGCRLKEDTSIKMHNTLIKMVSDSDGKSTEVLLSNLCEEVQWQFNAESDAFAPHSFEELRELKAEKEGDHETHIDMGSDQNDIDDLPKMVREILGYEKNINGFKARKVVTAVYPEDSDTRIIVEEFYTTKSQALSKISKAREDLSQKLGYDEDHVEGIPSLVDVIYERIKRDKEWDRPDGEIVRFVIRLLDEDDDDIFTMKYDVLEAETTRYQADHFALK
ncbi:MAG: hypothetical protein H8E26_14075 [FCB group bacterium]|nr:hypothetical protein [FCB group bacterium]MBL7027411.1 hypothetical protein [Candidatus Neomarinimicrobiota bacterium]MBL7122607.1 hypothetical protein [Candidatus Neomarinimicrobiota bacterium]